MKRWFVLLLIIVSFIMGYLVKGCPTSGHSPVATFEETEAKPDFWTCSMHPQVKLPKAGQCPICFMDLIPVTSGAEDSSGEHPRQLTMSEAAKALAEIQTSPVERKSVTKTIRMVGKVDYDETTFNHITTWVPGRIDRLYVDFTGVPVKKGAPMIYLYSPELLSAQEELLQSVQTLKKVQGTHIKETEEMALALVKSAEERLRLWGVTPKQIGAIKDRGKTTDHMTIYAPVSGIVIHKDGFEGMYVKTGTRIYTIADLSHVWVFLDAYESDIGWINNGQEVEFITEAYPGEVFLGRVAFIDPFLNEKTRTVKIRVNVPNPDGLLKPGMFVHGGIKAQIGGEKAEDNPLVIPVSAPLITGKRAIVYVEVPNANRPTYEGRVVKLGPRAGEYYVVKSGLAEGERVVVEGNFKIDSALQLQAKPSMMSAADKKTRTVPQDFLASLSPVIASYLSVHQALAGDDLNAAKDNLEGLLKAIGSVRMKLIKGETHTLWMKTASRMTEAVKSGLAASEIDQVRESFEAISEAMISVIKTFGHAEESALYEMFCPMALDNKEACWLQDKPDVANPYFGAKMLKCGAKQATYDPVDDSPENERENIPGHHH